MTPPTPPHHGLRQDEINVQRKIQRKIQGERADDASRFVDRASRRMLGLVASLAVVGILVGLPALLLTIGATPLPGASPSLTSLTDRLLAPDDGSLVLATLEVVAWAAWAFAAAGLLAELTALLRGVPAPRLPGLGTSQLMARTLLGLATLLFVAAPNVTGAAPAAATPLGVASSAPTTARPLHDPSTSTSGAATQLNDYASDSPSARAPSQTAQQQHARTPAQPQAFDYVVKPGESLWSIATQHLGNGSRFTEIVDLNRDLLGDKPSFLQPGWVLRIPANTTATGAPTGPRHHTVHPGDTLTAIADHYLGDPRRYPEIFHASASTLQADGSRLTDPDLIRPGWTLTIPGVTTSPAHSAPTEGRHGGGDHARPDGEAEDTADNHVDRGNVNHEDTTAGSMLGSRSDESTRSGDRSRTPDRIGDSADRDDRSGNRVRVDDEAGQDSIVSAPWFVTGLAGGGMLLAGGLLMALRARRRSQVRARRPGRTIAAPDPALAPVEKSIAAATGAAVTVEFLDHALRHLAVSVAATRSSMPPLAAVELGHSTLTLHLSAPSDLPSPWMGSVDRTHWHIDGPRTDLDVSPGSGSGNVLVDGLGIADESGHGRSADGPESSVSDLEAPYPLLVNIGTSDIGETWMLNCEELGAIAISGDRDNAQNFIRHLGAQIAVNPWSSRVTATCVGVAAEAASMDERLTYIAGAEDIETLVQDTITAAEASITRAGAHATDVATARTGYVDDDTWPARILLIEAASAEPSTLELLEHLTQLIADHPGQASTAIVFNDPNHNAHGASDHVVTLTLTSTGRLALEEAGLDLIAVGLTADEAGGCAQLYAQRADLDDVAVPVDDEPASDDNAVGWEIYADKAGALRDEYTRPRDTDRADDEDDGGEESGYVSLLDGPDEDYLRTGALTEDDLQAVAPKVSAGLRTDVETADPHLDQDVTDWFDPDCPRPRLILLGPVTARTHGQALTKRKPYFTELLAYLALRRRHGVTRDEVCDAFGISPGKCRDYINIVRDWLGTNPSINEPHLPHADKSPAAQARGLNLYQVDHGLLVDADLFKRLSLRGRTRGGADGQRDLATALRLVTGRPFDQLRPGGWTWLFEGERHDEYALVAVADVAFTLTTAYLATGDLVRARAATEIAMLAAPDEEVTRLCLVRITEAEGDAAGAQQILREQVCNRTDSDEAPTDLPERTETIIRNHQWLAS
ncbi:nucleoid-associated protein YgaU [Nocardioides sp. BE266]|uniref:LysM peptidoglycan-binding domain-containing protein n=1 Tax=Nocardioides sp. BE266 TaxID=2817725 RepID=UPI0028613E92|nr:LysM peptidoglycan-binding domain-containing protein [Nocardioides sp. BE266]MDR7254166.1 nucleoid-associated protein YgaU [Nocardioides sp. BE266]